MSDTDRIDSPYVGLQPFTEAARPFFFGRADDVERIVANFHASSLAVLYGVSGVGKSSVLAAGVAPRLREMTRCAVVMFSAWQTGAVENLKRQIIEAVGQASKQPFEADPAMRLDDMLLAATAALRGDVFVILDQFEEYFLYNPGESDPYGFEAELASAVNRSDVNVHFLLSLREDSISRLDRFRGRIPYLLSSIVRIDHLDRASAEEAVRKPLDEYCRRHPDAPVRIEDGLVAAVLDQVAAKGIGLDDASEADPASDARIETPFLQIVMMRLWRADAASGQLKLATLENLGGARKIVQSYVDDILGALSSSDQDVAAEMFRYLVTATGTKFALSAGELAENTGHPAEQIEVILRRLSAKDVHLLREVKGLGSQPDRFELYHDALGRRVRSWSDTLIALKQAQSRLDEQREKERRNWQKTLLAVALLGVVSILVLTTFFAASASHAAKAHALVADARQHEREHPGHVDVDLLLGLHSLRIHATPEAEELLEQSLEIFIPEAGECRVPSRIKRVVSSDSAATLAFSTEDHQVWLWRRGSAPAKLGDTIAVGRPAALTRDGRVLVTAGGDSVRVWSIGSQGITREQTWQGQRAWLSPTGRTVAVATDSVLELWDTDATRALRRTYLPGRIWNLVFSPAGDRVCVVGRGFAPHVFDVNSLHVNFSGGVAREDSRTWRRDASRSYAGERLKFSDGSHVVYCVDDSVIVIDSLGTTRSSVLGTSYSAFARISELRWSYALSPDGKKIAGWRDRMLRTWAFSAHDGRFWESQFFPQEEVVTGACFDPSGERVAALTRDGAVRVYGERDGREIGRFAVDGADNALAFDPTGRFLMVHSATTAGPASDEFGRIGDVPRAGGLLSVYEPRPLLAGQSAVMSRDGRYAAIFEHSRVRIVDVYTQTTSWMTPPLAEEPLLMLLGAGGTALAGIVDGHPEMWLSDGSHDVEPSFESIDFMSLSPDGDHLAVSSGGRLYLWAHEGPGHGNEVSRFVADESFSDVATADDPDLIAALLEDGNVRVWHVPNDSTGRLLRPLPDAKPGPKTHEDEDDLILELSNGGGRMRDIAFSQNGRRLAVVSKGRVVIMDPLAGQVVASDPRWHDARLIALDPVGSRLAILGNGGNLTVWNIATKELLRSLTPHVAISDVALSVSGDSIVAVNTDNTTTILSLTRKGLVDQVCSRLKRELTVAEWKDHQIPGPRCDACDREKPHAGVASQ